MPHSKIHWRLLGQVQLWLWLSTWAATSAALESTCQPGALQNPTPPPDLRINGNNLESPLISILDVDSQPMVIDYFPTPGTDPLPMQLRNVNGKGHLIKLSATRWNYWPSYQPPASQWNRNGSSTNKPAVPNITKLDICLGNFHSRLQIWPTKRLPKITGRYPNPVKSPRPHRYETPTSFIHVTNADTAALQLSPRFRVQQFLPSKQTTGVEQPWPQPLLVTMPLLQKLEAVLDVLARNGKPAATLQILSGFRTPRHNRRAGGARYSRHQYGDAADFIVDTNQDGKMDDLNDDGRINRADLRWLLDKLAESSVPVSAGGTGTYESHGPAEAFLHIDARGQDFYWQQ